MRELRVSMGMPSSIELRDGPRAQVALEAIFAWFDAVDARFSTYKKESEISLINDGRELESGWSAEMKEVMMLSEKTRLETDGYFDIRTPDGFIDPSGLVKGWALHRAAGIAHAAGIENFYIEIGGDIQTSGTAADGSPWSIGIRNPFSLHEIVKVVYPQGKGVATSGDYVRGQHIYNPHTKQKAPNDLASITVVGPNIYEADRFATAAYAMGMNGVSFIEALPEFEAYAIARDNRAYFTSGFEDVTHV